MERKYIVLHHSASPDGRILKDFDAIKAEHLRRGYRDIGYHWVIELVNGVFVATPGRAEWEDGAHCPGRNQDSIGICCVGNFQKDIPSEQLYRFVAAKCRDIMTRHPIKEIGGHRDYFATVCPGTNFNVDHIRQLVKGGSPMDIDEALIVLQSKGIISKPDYWKMASQCVKYLDNLIISVANHIV